ncbi:MAG: hypothetical protein ACLP5H_34460 [Desulfomonilaceae bacterium]
MTGTEAVAYYALIGVLASSLVAVLIGLLTSIYNARNLNWKKEQWLKDKKETAYFECLKCPYESRIFTYEGLDGQRYIGDRHFNDRIASLKLAVPWLTMVAGYSPGISRTQLEQIRDELHELIRKVQTADSRLIEIMESDGTVPTIEARLDEGLSEALEKAMSVVAECAKTELLKGIS